MMDQHVHLEECFSPIRCGQRVHKWVPKTLIDHHSGHKSVMTTIPYHYSEEVTRVLLIGEI